jgi:hypothetical protein
MSTVKLTLDELKAGIKLATGEAHTIVLKRTMVEVRILDSKGSPVADLLCQIALPGENPQAFYTDADGWIHADVSPAEGEVKLTIPEVDRRPVPAS